MKHTTLKPCPFCGAKESTDKGATGVWFWRLGENGPWLVECECGARSHYKIKSRKAAIEVWNTRSQLEAKSGWIKFSEKQPPNKDKRYLVYIDSSGSLGHSEYIWCDFWWQKPHSEDYWWTNLKEDETVIYWQPVKPPEAK
jgi:hypothetical protein